MVFLQQVINGLAQGGIYALIAIGWTTVFGIVGVMNWTHGEIYMLGAYAGYFLTTMGLPMVPALLLSMAVGSLIAMAVDHFGYRPLRKAGTLATSGFITALGLSTFLRYTANAVFTVNPRAYPELVEYRLITLFTFKGQAITISSMHLMILIGTVIIMIILELFIRKTLVGKAMLAASQDMQTLGLMGAAAGFFIGTIYSINPMMGALAGLKGWSCAILGGIGSITGSLVGGILLGIAENLTEGFISTGYKDAIGFVIMILVLIIRPTGFMGYKFEEKV